jgi:hypothetical protein
MLVVLVMFMLSLSKVLEPVGNQCLETGVKIGKAILTLMDKAFPLRSPQVMGAVWFLTMLSLLDGPLARPLVVINSHKTHLTGGARNS